MLLGEWVLLGLCVVTIILFVVIIVVESLKSKKKHYNNTENKESFVRYNNVEIVEKFINCYTEGINIPKHVREFGCVFLLETGEKRSYLVPQFVFEQLKEQDKGNLYIKDNSFFDFEVTAK